MIGLIVRATIVFQLATLSLFQFTQQAAYADPAEVILIRHAEKPPTGNALSPRGRERAGALRRISNRRRKCSISNCPWPFTPSGRKMQPLRFARSKRSNRWPTLFI